MAAIIEVEGVCGHTGQRLVTLALGLGALRFVRKDIGV
jgi:hypothetical protein